MISRGERADMERVDVTGEVCPRPALIVRRRLEGMEPGEKLVVRGDYSPAERNLRRTCAKHGFEVTAPEGADDDTFTLHVRVTEQSSVSGAGE